MACSTSPRDFLDLLAGLPQELRDMIFDYSSDRMTTIFNYGLRYYSTIPLVLEERDTILDDFLEDIERRPAGDLTHIIVPCTVSPSSEYRFPNHKIVRHTSDRIFLRLKRVNYDRNVNCTAYSNVKNKYEVHETASIAALLSPHLNASHIAIEITGDCIRIDGQGEDVVDLGGSRELSVHEDMCSVLEMRAPLQEYSVRVGGRTFTHSKRAEDGTWPDDRVCWAWNKIANGVVVPEHWIAYPNGDDTWVCPWVSLDEGWGEFLRSLGVDA